MVAGGAVAMDGHFSPSPDRAGRMAIRAELKTPSPVSGAENGESTETRKHSPWTAPRQRKKQFVRRESSSPQKFPTSFPISCATDAVGTPRHDMGAGISVEFCAASDELEELCTPHVDSENYDEALGEDDPAWRASMTKRRSRSFSGTGSIGASPLGSPPAKAPRRKRGRRRAVDVVAMCGARVREPYPWAGSTDGELNGSGQEWVRHSNPEPVSMVHDHCEGATGGGAHDAGADRCGGQCRLHGEASCLESAQFCQDLRDGARHCGVEHAEEMIMSRWETDVPPSADVYHTLMELWEDAGDVERLRDVVGRMWALGSRCSAVNPTVATYTLLVRGHVRQYGPAAAEALLTEMGDLGLEPDSATYNAVLRGYAELGDAEGAEGLLVEMGRAGVSPNASTYHLVAGACLRAEQLGLGEGAAPEAAG